MLFPKDTATRLPFCTPRFFSPLAKELLFWSSASYVSRVCWCLDITLRKYQRTTPDTTSSGILRRPISIFRDHRSKMFANSLFKQRRLCGPSAIPLLSNRISDIYLRRANTKRLGKKAPSIALEWRTCQSSSTHQSAKHYFLVETWNTRSEGTLP